MTSEAVWPTSEGYSHSHVWLCSSFTTWSDRCSLQCFTVRITKPHVRTNRQKKTRAGTLVIDDLCERKDGQRRWPHPASYRSLWTRTSLMTADLWRCFTYRTYRGRQGQGGKMRSFSQFGTIYTTAGSRHASLCSKRDGSDLQSNESLDDNWINLMRLLSRGTLQFDFYSSKEKCF